MARLNRKGELWQHLSSVAFIRETTTTHGSTTLNAAVAAGASTLNVAAITNFAVAETIVVGNGEVSEVLKIHASTAPAAGVITLDPAYPANFAHNIGETVKEQTATDVGHVADDGVAIEYGGGSDMVLPASRRLLLGALSGYFNITCTFSLLGWNLENFCAALGMLESRVIGAGTPSNPSTLDIDTTRIKEENDIAIRFTGVRKDGGTVIVEAWGVELDMNAIRTTLARGQQARIPVIAHATAGIFYQTY